MSKKKEEEEVYYSINPIIVEDVWVQLYYHNTDWYLVVEGKTKKITAKLAFLKQVYEEVTMEEVCKKFGREVKIKK